MKQQMRVRMQMQEAMSMVAVEIEMGVGMGIGMAVMALPNSQIVLIVRSQRHFQEPWSHLISVGDWICPSERKHGGVCSWRRGKQHKYVVCTARAPNEQSAGATGKVDTPCLHNMGAVSPSSHRVGQLFSEDP